MGRKSNKNADVFLQRINEIKKKNINENSYNWGVSRGFIKRITPYFEKIDDEIKNSIFSSFFICSSAQSGKTIYIANRIHYLLTLQMGFTIGYAMPSQSTARDISKRLFSRIINSDDFLKNLVNEKFSTIYDYYIGNSRLKFIWTSSTNQLCSETFDEVYLDELDRTRITEEGDIVQLMQERLKVKNGKLIAISTPTRDDGYIWKNYLKGTQKLISWECPHCKNIYAPSFGTGADCPECGHVVTETEKKNLNKNLQFVSNNSTAEHESYLINGYFSPWQKIETLDKKRTQIANFSFEEKKAIINTTFGECFNEEPENGDILDAENITVEDLKKCVNSVRFEYKKIICGIDVQGNRIYYVVRGVNGEKSQLLEYAERFGDVNDFNFFKLFFEQLEKKYKIDYYVVDIGFIGLVLMKMKHQLKKNNIVFIRGCAYVAPITFKKVYNENVIYINDNTFKYSLITAIKRGKNFQFLTYPTEDYIHSLMAEKLIDDLRRGRTFKRIEKRNDYFDCEKYILAVQSVKNGAEYEKN